MIQKHYGQVLTLAIAPPAKIWQPRPPFGERSHRFTLPAFARDNSTSLFGVQTQYVPDDTLSNWSTSDDDDDNGGWDLNPPRKIPQRNKNRRLVITISRFKMLISLVNI
ncbi:hypothetical protein SLE2022_346500 [Rubroshorea leprosula]